MDRRVVENGRIPGKVPLGYRSLGSGKVEPDPLTAPLVIEAFRMSAEGISLRKISAVLATKGLLNSNGVPMGPSALAKVLANPFYIGKIRLGAHLFDGQHVPLVSVAMFGISADAIRRCLR